MGGGRLVLDSLGGGVGAVVEEDATAGEPVGRPVVDAAFVVGGGAQDIGTFSEVIEGLGGFMGEVSEAVVRCERWYLIC